MSAVAAWAPPAYARAPKIRIGQIGTGHAHAGGVFKSLLQVRDHFDVVGVVENDPERRKKLGGSYQGIPLITEEQLLSTPGLKAVVVETEVEHLVPTAQRCIDAGMHIHLDKPPGETYQAYKALQDEAARRKLTIQMGYIYRYRSCLLYTSPSPRD